MLGDFLALIFAFGIGVLSLVWWGEYSNFEDLQNWWRGTGSIHSSVQLVFIGLTLIRFYTKGLYSKRLPFWDELLQILITLLYLALINGMVVLIAKWPFSRTVWLVGWCAAAFFVPITRALVKRILDHFGLWKRNTFIVGTGSTAFGAYKALLSEPRLGFNIVQFVQIGDAVSNELPREIPIHKIPLSKNTLEAQQSLIDYLKNQSNAEIVLALDDESLSASEGLVEALSLQLRELHVIPSLHGLPLFGMDVNHFFSHEILVLRSRNNLSMRPQQVAKRLFDFFGALAILIMASPLLLWISFRIWRNGGGVLFRHTRLGLSGRNFPCYKFRTMVPNADEVLKELLNKDPEAKKEWEEKTKITHDPRITPIGHFLRRSSLDELPQLFNVLKGEMSLVGPRPIVQHEVVKYGIRYPFYTHVKPGLTGLWQVSGRSDTSFETRVQLDTWYVKNWTLWYDIAILFKTVNVVLRRKGAY